ncbi:MAG: NAD(P)-dependent oxidoreductase, partial [Crocinitomicaceae bacterium]|nr:NAD(P)-dependent oxidoreductase [Crocinitomicaceae bacterium]
MKNKKILITGASSGIGWSIAKILSVNGHQLILCGRNKKKLN